MHPPADYYPVQNQIIASRWYKTNVFVAWIDGDNWGVWIHLIKDPAVQ